MTLQQIWDELNSQGMGSDKGDLHTYLPVYEEILAPYRATAWNVLELGIFNGASLLLWEQYFNCPVYGIDCDEQPHGGLADLRLMIADKSHNIVIMDATNEVSVNDRFSKIKFDVIIEDAGHSVEQQVLLYHIFKNYLSPAGIYIIEDIQSLDTDRKIFESLDNDKEITILDRRNMKDRYDDVMVIIKNINRCKKAKSIS